MPTVELRDIVTEADRAAALAVEAGPGQERFVPSVAQSLLDAVEYAQARARSWTVNDGDAVVGFVMLSDGVEPEVYEADPHMVARYFLMRLLIDRRQQRRGYGTAALDALIRYVRERPAADALYTSAAPGAGSPQAFYERFGFAPTGAVVDDTVVLRLDLADRSSRDRLLAFGGQRSPDRPFHGRSPRESKRVTQSPTNDPGPAVADLDTIVSLAKRRGFVYPSSEIYGGINAVWDYGPLGVELKNNVKRAWWRAMVQERDDIVGLDAGILMHPQVWVTSGHVGSFSDPLVECQTDHRRFRLDELPGGENLSATDLRDPGIVERLGLKCPIDGGPLSAPRQFNLMFKTHMGPIEEDSNAVYLRPETAQGSYVNFKNVQQSSRKKLPFGIAQIGKSFRNEISPGNFVFRMREFEQMEMQYFVRPDQAAQIFEEWLPRRWDWYVRYGVNPARLRFREHAPDELAHYAKKAIDVEYRFPFGWKELEGIHNRGDFDLSRHQAESGENLEYFDPATEEHFVPFIVETAGGPDRSAFTFLIDSYREEEVRGEKRVVLGLSADLAPYKVAVLPLLKKRPEIVEIAHKLRDDIARDTMAVYDDTAAIGKLYRRQDEIGTPWCVCIDVESLEDGAATIRDRDTMTQERVPIDGIKRAILDKLSAARG